MRAARNLPEDLIRLCVGIEDPQDLIDDLEAALLEAGAVRVVDEAGARATLERVRPAGEDVVELSGLREVQRFEAGRPEVERVMTSAPGKVILFGEHAVVHGVVRVLFRCAVASCSHKRFADGDRPLPQTAIAGAIDLRCYCLAEARSDGHVSLSLPDLGYSQSWDLSTLPWHLVSAPLSSLKTGPKPDTVPSAELLALLANQFVHQDQLKAVQAAQAFLYLYMHLCAARGDAARPAQSFTIRSGLPIGAGLGSSAAYSVALASALLYSHGVLPLPSGPGAAEARITRTHADLVNAHAFLAEKVIHGTPSGIDNTVAALGGAVAFRRAVKGREGMLEPLGPQEGEGAGSAATAAARGIRFLLTDTKVPRDTKTLVAGVARRKLEVRRRRRTASFPFFTSCAGLTGSCSPGPHRSPTRSTLCSTRSSASATVPTLSSPLAPRRPLRAPRSSQSCRSSSSRTTRTSSRSGSGTRRSRL